MQSYREDCNDAKAARQGIVEQRPLRIASKKSKPVIVQSRRHKRCALPQWMIEPKWRKWGSYRTAEEAQKVIDLQSRKHSDLWEFRIKPEEV
jgi:hypothetical protein